MTSFSSTFYCFTCTEVQLFVGTEAPCCHTAPSTQLCHVSKRGAVSAAGSPSAGSAHRTSSFQRDFHLVHSSSAMLVTRGLICVNILLSSIFFAFHLDLLPPALALVPEQRGWLRSDASWFPCFFSANRELLHTSCSPQVWPSMLAAQMNEIL